MKRENKIKSTIHDLDTDGVVHKLKPRLFTSLHISKSILWTFTQV